MFIRERAVSFTTEMRDTEWVGGWGRGGLAIRDETSCVDLTLETSLLNQNMHEAVHNKQGYC